ncbi:hypothetical protein YC2023_007073 [Brassica napus]
MEAVCYVLPPHWVQHISQKTNTPRLNRTSWSGGKGTSAEVSAITTSSPGHSGFNIPSAGALDPLREDSSPPPPYSFPSTRLSPVPDPSGDDSMRRIQSRRQRLSPAPEERKPDDIKASEEGDEFEKEEDSCGMSGLKKAGIAIGAILGVGAIVMGAIVYKKRRDNLTRARYTYFQGEFL